MESDRVVLTVDGMAYAGWLAVRIARGVDRAAGDFALTVTAQHWPIRPGMACALRIGPDRLITGFVDEVAPRYDGRSHSIEVKGRSATADLVDCSAVNRPGQWRGQSLQRIAEELARPYGVQVRVEGGGVVPDHQLQPGESVLESLNRAAAPFGLVASDDAEGRLRLFRPGSGPRTVPLAAGQGGGVLSTSARFSHRDRFARYVVKGQQGGLDLAEAGQVAQASGAATDPAIRPARTLVLVSGSPADAARCRERAGWEAANRAGRGTEITVTVPGWRMPDGRLWPVNGILPYRDGFLGIEADLLIAEVEYSRSAEGTLTTLRLTLPNAYRPEPVVPANPKLAGYAGLLRQELQRYGQP